MTLINKDIYKIVNKNQSYGVSDKTYKNLAEAKEAAILKSAFTGGNFKVFKFEPILSLFLEVK
tara:strand:+ start:64 stop:252 length:189 start_codon:yes stop_codon:yes gene_type:complete